MTGKCYISQQGNLPFGSECIISIEQSEAVLINILRKCSELLIKREKKKKKWWKDVLTFEWFRKLFKATLEQWQKLSPQRRSAVDLSMTHSLRVPVCNTWGALLAWTQAILLTMFLIAQNCCENMNCCVCISLEQAFHILPRIGVLLTVHHVATPREKPNTGSREGPFAFLHFPA